MDLLPVTVCRHYCTSMMVVSVRWLCMLSISAPYPVVIVSPETLWTCLPVKRSRLVFYGAFDNSLRLVCGYCCNALETLNSERAHYCKINEGDEVEYHIYRLLCSFPLTSCRKQFGKALWSWTSSMLLLAFYFKMAFPCFQMFVHTSLSFCA